jgi:hypothetical protein|tara:strand:- start:1959 stop:3131 length:1173 start_codon:yes stop_codon:yes gene_type:complete
MAVKFSAFTQKTTAESANVTEIVGYLSTGDENIRIAPSAFDTTYAFTTVTNSGTPTNVDFIATATKGTQASTTETVVFAAGTAISLTAGTREITIANTGVTSFNQTAGSTSLGTALTVAGTGSGPYTGAVTIAANIYAGGSNIGIVPSGGSAGTYLDGAIGAWTALPSGYLPWSFTADTGTNETVASGAAVTFAGGTIISTVASSPDTLTVNHSAVTRSDTTSSDTPSGGGTVDLVKTITTSTEGHVTAVDISTVTWPAGDTYTLQAGTKVGSSVPLQLDAATGSDSTVNLTQGTGITLTQTSATEITIEGTAGVTVTKEQFTGNNSDTVFTLATTTTTNNINIFINGVYQNSVDSSGAANYAVTSGTTLTFITAPPTTATNGIEVVITQ